MTASNDVAAAAQWLEAPPVPLSPLSSLGTDKLICQILVLQSNLASNLPVTDTQVSGVGLDGKVNLRKQNRYLYELAL